ncbi:MAG: VOC family protein [Desulfobacteraceae bacterium]|nr:MAG: VOC family protein [Desulfobacteraceae bacterium]
MHFNEISGTEPLQELLLPPASQIGITVSNLEKGVRFYQSLLHVKKWYRTKITDADYFYKDKAIDQKLDIVVGYWGKMQLELIQQNCSVENIYTRHAAPGGFGLHHLGVVVGDLERKVSMLRDMGILPLQTGTIRFGRGGLTHFAYMDSMARAGFILELIETRAFGLNLGMPEWLVNIGRATGDTELFESQ